MAITYTGTGGIFTRLGKILGGIKAINGIRAETTAVGVTDDATAVWGLGLATVKNIKQIVTDIQGQYLSTLIDKVDGIVAQRDNFRNSVSAILSYLSSLASATLIQQVHDDAVLPQKTLALAMAELIRQMNVDTKTVKYNNVSVAVAAIASPANTGNSTVVASVLGPTGLLQQHAFPEVIELRVTGDSQSGSTARSEPLSITGELAQSDVLDWTWPDGSSCTNSMTMCDSRLDASVNLLTNSDFEAFTSNKPDNWNIVVGTAGTDILKTVSVTYDSTGAALEFKGTGGAVLSEISQIFGTNTTATLKPNTVYAFNAYIKDSGAGLLAGVAKFAIKDGSDVVVNDDQGTANATTVAFSATTATYAAINGFFRTPKVMPTTIKFSLGISTALTSGESMYIDDLAMCEATLAYPGGPYVAAFAASTDPIAKDLWNVTVTNAGGGLIQTGFEQLFGMRALGLQLPYNTGGGENIADTLVS